MISVQTKRKAGLLKSLRFEERFPKGQITFAVSYHRELKQRRDDDDAEDDA